MYTLTDRERDLVNFLINSKSKQSGDSIATILGVSTRTVRNDIKKINNILEEFNADITAYKGKGYQLNVYHINKFNEFKRTILDLTTRHELVNLLIGKLLINTFTGKILYQQDLADDLYISLSSLKNILSTINNKMLNDLEIKVDNLKGVRITGNEEAIRFGISEYIFNNKTNSYRDYNYLFPINEMDQIKVIVEGILVKNNLLLTDIAIDGLIVHIMIAKSRVMKFDQVYEEYEKEEIKNSDEFIIAKEIASKLSDVFIVNIDTEVFYLTRHLLASSRLDDKSIDSYDHTNVFNMLDKVITTIKERTSINFNHDEELKRSLAVHLGVALNRIKFNMNIRNDFLKTIKSDYPLAFEIAIIACEELKKITNLNIDENEIGFIAIHFGASLERMKFNSDERIKKIIVVCGAGVATASLIRKKVKTLLKDEYVDIEVISKSLFHEDLIQQSDLILSTIPLDTNSKKVLMINPVLSKRDLKEIKDFTDELKALPVDNIKDFFAEELFIRGVELTTKMEVLDHVTTLMKKQGYIDQDTKNSFYARERMASTEIGGLLAMPHTLNNNMPKAMVAICILNKPIIWDKEKVQVILLLSIPHKMLDIWESVFRVIYNFLLEDNGVSELLTDYKYDDFIQKLEEGRRS